MQVNMSRAIYSLYIDIPEDELDFFDKDILKEGKTPTNINTKNKFKEDYEKIIENKQRYAAVDPCRRLSQAYSYIKRSGFI